MTAAARVRVKICGITRLEDALQAVALGADAIGLILAPGSPRCLDPQQARKISLAIPPLVTRIALLRNPEPDDLERLTDQVPVDLIQFHGSESERLCRRSPVPYIKALSVDETAEPNWDQAYPGAQGFVIDSHVKGGSGGTGQSFDWRRFPKQDESTQRPLILAGGLNVDNVAAAIKQCQPYAVDVSSGVESSPGIKDPVLMSQFMIEVRGANEG